MSDLTLDFEHGRRRRENLAAAERLKTADVAPSTAASYERAWARLEAAVLVVDEVDRKSARSPPASHAKRSAADAGRPGAFGGTTSTASSTPSPSRGVDQATRGCSAFFAARDRSSPIPCSHGF